MGNQLLHSERMYIRKVNRQMNDNKMYLQNFVEAFLKECFKKSEKEIKEIYFKYDNLWIEHCRKQNAKHTNVAVADKNKVITLFEDAFEGGVANGHQSVKGLKEKYTGKESTAEQKFHYKEYVRTFDIFKQRNKFQAFIHMLSKHFFVKGTYTKYKTGNDPLPKYEDAPPPPQTKLSIVK